MAGDEVASELRMAQSFATTAADEASEIGGEMEALRAALLARDADAALVALGRVELVAQRIAENLDGVRSHLRAVAFPD